MVPPGRMLHHDSKSLDLGSDECYRSINHPERMMKKMEAYLCKRQLCDVTLLTGTRRVAAHRVVLSAASDYFAAMFTSDVKEATMEEIRLKDVDSEALANLIQYMYTGKSEMAPVADEIKIQEIERNTKFNVRPKLCHI